MIFEELGEKATDHECRIMIETHDIDGDKELSFEEFVNLMMANWIIYAIIFLGFL